MVLPSVTKDRLAEDLHLPAALLVSYPRRAGLELHIIYALLVYLVELPLRHRRLWSIPRQDILRDNICKFCEYSQSTLTSRELCDGGSYETSINLGSTLLARNAHISNSVSSLEMANRGDLRDQKRQP